MPHCIYYNMIYYEIIYVCMYIYIMVIYIYTYTYIYIYVHHLIKPVLQMIFIFANHLSIYRLDVFGGPGNAWEDLGWWPLARLMPSSGRSPRTSAEPLAARAWGWNSRSTRPSRGPRWFQWGIQKPYKASKWDVVRYGRIWISVG